MHGNAPPVEYCPAAQAVQPDWDVKELYVPVAHTVQPASPAVAAY